ncbi:MAG: DEAD/DEAH box helicase, partial [Planctomycetota bacterium]
MILRHYQHDAAVEVLRAWHRYRRLLVCWAPGLGKTIFGAYVVNIWANVNGWRDYGSPSSTVLWLAYTDEQVDQAVGAITEATGEEPAVEKAERRIKGDMRQVGKSVVVSSVQSMMQPERLAYFSEGTFGLVVWDEGHHIVCDGAEPIIGRFAGAKMLVLTATPNRTDEVPLGKVVDHVAHHYSMFDAIKDGWLCRLMLQHVSGIKVDWSWAKAESGLSEKRVQEIIDEEGSEVHGLVKAIIDYAGDRQTVIYTARVIAAEVIAKLLNRYAPNHKAEFVSGFTPEDRRRGIVDGFREGEYQ